MTHDSKLWIFAYGSLLWNAGFRVVEQQRASLSDYERSFCMRSIHHRGTPARPGLVLALAKKTGGCCTGMALRCDDDCREETLVYLRKRELVSSAYKETQVRLTLASGASCTATAFVMDHDHEQFCGDLPLEEQARIIANAQGGRGKNSEYLSRTVSCLNDLGIPDEQLERLDCLVRKILAHPRTDRFGRQ